MRNLRLLLEGAIYRLFVTISVAELAVICPDQERDYHGIEIESETTTARGTGTLDAAPRAIDFCHVTSPWHIH